MPGSPIEASPMISKKVASSGTFLASPPKAERLVLCRLRYKNPARKNRPAVVKPRLIIVSKLPWRPWKFSAKTPRTQNPRWLMLLKASRRRRSGWINATIAPYTMAIKARVTTTVTTPLLFDASGKSGRLNRKNP